jgi:hypothetical protein
MKHYERMSKSNRWKGEKVDTNGDAIADIAYRFTFSPKEETYKKRQFGESVGNRPKDF